MNPQNLTTLDKTETQLHLPVPAPVNTAQNEIPPAVHATTDAEVRQAFQQTKAPWSTRWLLGNTRGYGSSIKIEEKEADRLLKMDVEEIVELLRKERRSWRRQKFRSIQVGLGYVVFAVALAKFAHIPFFMDHIYGIFGGLCAGTFVVSQKVKAAALALARFNDVRAVGPLAETLEFKDPYVRSIASRALIRLLPRMQASDAALLSPAQRACLNRVLKQGEAPLILAILKAWEQVGDADAIETVEHLSYGRLPAGGYRQVVAAARECLPFLRQSAERQQVGAGLLRPVDGGAAPSQVLLRPAQPHTSADPSDQLLRSSDSA